MTKLPSSPEWAGGVWYDPCLLPSLDSPAAIHNAEITRVCALTWDVIVKKWDATSDTFAYKRIANVEISDNWLHKKRVYVYSPVDPSYRVVAIMPHNDWLNAFEGRLTGKDFNGKGASDASLDRAISSALGTPDE